MYSLVYRLQLQNNSGKAVFYDSWRMRLPVGARYVGVNGATSSIDANWTKIEGGSIVPYSSFAINISFSGIQRYPEIANRLMKDVRSIDIWQYKERLFEPSELGIRELFDWVDSYLLRVSNQTQALTLEEIYKIKKGDCTEFTLLSYYALKKSGFDKIFPVVGFYVPDDAPRIVNQKNFHAWLLIEIAGQWYVVDPLYKKIELPSEQYIVVSLMSEGRNISFIDSEYPKIYLGRNG